MGSNFDNARVLVACNYTTHGVSTAHAHSLADFCSQASDLIRTGRVNATAQYDPQIDLCRSRFALTASIPENGYTHLFMYDADMQLSIEHINTLLGRDVDVISGTYFKRATQDGMEFPCVASRDGRFITREEIAGARMRDELIPVHGVGGGCLLIKTDVLRAIGQPAFKFEFYMGAITEDRRGEDSFFSDRARKVGYKIWMDPTVTPWHMADVKIGFDITDSNGVQFYTPNY